jgi:cyclophilin family peptidyl-prolyl cis-trans isomerase
VLSYRAVRRSLPILVIAAAIAGCGSSSSSSSGAPPTTSAAAVQTSTAAAAATCGKVSAPAPRNPGRGSPPVLRLNPHRKYVVTVATNCGNFAFSLDVKDSPRTAASFYVLVRRGFFDGVTFHRVASGFVIQGGDPTGTGGGGPGYTVVETPPANTQYVRGIVAMAKTGTQPAGASGSQFFVVTAANAGLPPDYAVLGRIVSGQDVVDKIGALPTNPPQDGAPVQPVVMSKVTVTTH